MNPTAALPIVGVDLAESVFQLAIADANGRLVERQRWLSGLGIEARLLPAPYVRA